MSAILSENIIYDFAKLIVKKLEPPYGYKITIFNLHNGDVDIISHFVDHAVKRAQDLRANSILLQAEALPDKVPPLLYDRLALKFDRRTVPRAPRGSRYIVPSYHGIFVKLLEGTGLLEKFMTSAGGTDRGLALIKDLINGFAKIIMGHGTIHFDENIIEDLVSNVNVAVECAAAFMKKRSEINPWRFFVANIGHMIDQALGKAQRTLRFSYEVTINFTKKRAIPMNTSRRGMNTSERSITRRAALERDMYGVVAPGSYKRFEAFIEAGLSQDAILKRAWPSVNIIDLIAKIYKLNDQVDKVSQIKGNMQLAGLLWGTLSDDARVKLINQLFLSSLLELCPDEKTVKQMRELREKEKARAESLRDALRRKTNLVREKADLLRMQRKAK